MLNDLGGQILFPRGSLFPPPPLVNNARSQALSFSIITPYVSLGTLLIFLFLSSLLCIMGTRKLSSWGVCVMIT